MKRLDGRLAAPARALVVALGVGAAVGALAIAESAGRNTTYAGRSPAGAALTMVAGLGLVVAGAVFAFGRQARRVGDLALLAGMTWFAPVFVAWHDGPALAPSMAAVLAGFTFPLVFHLVLAYPTGRVPSRPLRALVGLTYLEAVFVAVALALFRDPYLDPTCWANCSVNSFRVHSFSSFTNRVETADRWFVAGAACVLIAMSVVRLLRASRVARTHLVVVLGAALLFAAAVVARAVALERATIENPFDDALFAIFAVASTAILVLAGGLLCSRIRSELERRSVLRVVSSLGDAPAPGALQTALGSALGDSGLRVVYWLPESSRYVDAEGSVVSEPVPRNGRAVTRIARDGRTVALISHSGTVVDLESRLGPAIRLGLENERLQAEVLSQLGELRRSRARIVETADRERRRLERDLHDGAQQRLLALSYEIRLAHASARSEAEPAAEQVLAEAVEVTQVAFDDLRELAHGIYPAVLAEGGLGAAVATLADTAPLPIELVGLDGERFSSSVETTAYVAVSEALEDAAARGACHAVARFLQMDGRLVVTVEDDGAERASALVALADRVGALGGSVDFGATGLRAEIPCA